MHHRPSVRGPDTTGDAVAAAMAAIDRADFLPDSLRERAPEDVPVPIGHGQTNSQPRTVANMLRLLGVRPGHHVLDVGAGSGWTTALLGHLVGRHGSVIGVELDPELAGWGAGNVAGYAMPWAELHPAQPGVLGWPQAAPYDRILVSAAARKLPDALVRQLKSGGVMVIPVRGTMLRVTTDEHGDVTTTRHGSYRFVPLR
jgi:protein-L-isoaspartate(D-aspartate) O-methyltransferase